MALARWQDPVRTHPLWERVQASLELLDQRDLEDDEQVDLADRIRAAFAALQERRDASPHLVPNPLLEATHQAVNQIHSQLQQWQADGNVSYLRAAGTDQMAPFLGALSQWPVDDGPEGATRAALTLVDAHERKATGELDTLRTEVARLHQEAQARQAELAQVKAELDAKQQTLSAQIETAQATIQQEVARLDALTTQQSQAFADAETARGTDFQAAFAKVTTDAATLATTNDAASQQQRETLKAAAEAVIVEMKGHEQEARKLLNVTAETTTATEYGRYAAQERGAGKWMRGFAIASFFGALLLSIILIANSHEGALPWQAVALRLGATVALLAAGAFCAAESHDHFQQERLYKRIQLDLAAVGPFIVNLDPEEQKDIRAAAARRLFTQPDPPLSRRRRRNQFDVQALADAAAKAAVAQAAK